MSLVSFCFSQETRGLLDAVTKTADPTPSNNSRHTSVVGGSFAVALSTAIGLAGSFLLSVIVARLFGPEVKGQLALLLEIPLVAALILGLGFEGAKAYYVGRRLRLPEHAVSDSMYLALSLSLIGVPMVAIAMHQLIPALATIPLVTIIAASLALPFMMIINLLSGVLTGLGKVTEQAIATTIAAIVSFLLAITLALLGHLTLHTLILATLAGLTCASIAMFVATKVKTLTAPSHSRLREEISYAGRSYVQTIMGYLELRQDLILLGVLTSATSVGIYSIGVSIAEVLFYAPQAIAAALAARAFQEGASEGAKLTALITRLLSVLLLVASVALILAARTLVVTIFGEPFAEAALVIQILVPAIAIWGIAAQSSVYLASHGTLFPKLSVATLILNLGLNILLIPELGILGAAVATLISYTIGSVYIIGVFLKTTGIGLAGMLIVRRSDIAFALGAVRAFTKRKSS